MAVSTQDFIHGIDLSGQSQASGTQINQEVDNATPYTDKGLTILTTDLAGPTPVVPDASVTTKWKTYLWVRQTTSAIIVYAWNDNAVSVATYLKWQAITVASLADGSVTTAKIADGAVTNAKITSVDWSKITSIPAGFAPSGAAGGDLIGTYPNPTIGVNAVNGSKLLGDAAVDANRAVTVATHIKIGTALQQIRTNAGATAAEWFTPAPIALLAGLGTAFQVPRTNSGAAAVEWAMPTFYRAVYNHTDAAALPPTGGGDVSRSFAHGLLDTTGAAAKPFAFIIMLVCNSTELGYAVGDEVPLYTLKRAAGNDGVADVSASADVTNITLTWDDSVIGIPRLPAKTAPYAMANIAPAKWNFMIKAWL